jgi:hypothetical protein
MRPVSLIVLINVTVERVITYLLLRTRASIKGTQIKNFIKILPVEAELFHADGQTDITTLIIAVSDFANTVNIA